MTYNPPDARWQLSQSAMFVLIMPVRSVGYGPRPPLSRLPKLQWQLLSNCCLQAIRAFR